MIYLMRRVDIIWLFLAVFLTLSLICGNAFADSANDLEKSSVQSLHALYQKNPLAESLSHKASAILVFPNIIKAGLVFGGAYGEGVLLKEGRPDGYYNTVSASWGWQAGATSYGYVVFLMNKKAIDYLKKSNGWEFGSGPSIVVVNKGIAKNMSTTTLRDDAYAFIFDQQGLMGSISIEGTKISKITR